MNAESIGLRVGAETSDSPTTPVSRGFMAGYVIAQVGAYVSFLPLLLILAPLRAEALAPGHKEVLLSQIASLGALVAAGANLLAGWVSDRTRSRWGRRRPWIVAGTIGTALSYGLIALAGTPLALVGSILIFQLVFNFAFAPLGALIPDRVPDRQKGWVSALTGLGLPIGSVIGSTVVGVLVVGELARFGALALIVVMAIAPFAILIRDPLPASAKEPKIVQVRAPRRRFLAWPRVDADFVYVWLGRCFVQTAFSLVQIYLLFFLQESLSYGAGRAARPEGDMASLSVVFAVANVLAGLAAGWLSDRAGRRKPFVMLGALIIAAASLGLATAHIWPQIAASYALLGCGTGCYFAIDLALVAQVLPSSRTTGRDLGVINLASTIPQVVAPAMAALLLSLPGTNLRWVFTISAILAVVGATMAAPIRKIR